MPARHTRRVRRAPPTFYSKPWKPAEGCLYIIQANLKLRILLPQFPTYRNRRYAQPSLASSVVLPISHQVGSNRPALPLSPLSTSIHWHQIGTGGTRSRCRGCCREKGRLTLPLTHNDSHQRPVPGITHTHVNTASLHPRH